MKHHPADPTTTEIDPLTGEPVPAAEQERGGCGWMLLLAMIGVTALVGFGLWAAREIQQRNLAQPLLANFSGISALPTGSIRPAGPDAELKIYFIAREQFLAPQARMVPGGASDIERIHRIAHELESPPATGLLDSPLAGEVNIRGLYLLDRILYLDLTRDFQQRVAASPIQERLAVFSLVNSFMLNVQELGGVQLMIEGEMVPTAGGWLDLSTPLGQDLSLVR